MSRNCSSGSAPFEIAIFSKGALPESISTQSEYISEKSLLRVTVYGNMRLDVGGSDTKEIDDEEAEVLACELFGINEGVHRIFWYEGLLHICLWNP